MISSLLIPSDKDLDAIANAMPDGMKGFCKEWGYLHFGRQVAESVISKASVWVSVDDRLPGIFPPADIPVWTWDGVKMRSDLFGAIFIKSVAQRDFVRIGDWFRLGYSGKRITHWMLRVKPEPPQE